MKPLFSLCAVAAMTGHAALAFADEATDIATARSLGQDGVILADQGKCPQAIEKLTRAEKLHHAPTTALRLAECEIEIGRVVAGTERLERIVREPLAANAPAAFTAAVARAQTVLATAQPRIATLHITVKAPAGTAYTVTVDDEVVPGAMIDADRPTDPGARKLAATAKGFLPASADVSLKDGESTSAQLTLVPDPHANADAPGRDGPTSFRTGPNDGGRSVVPWIAIGAGVAGIALGAVSGAVVASKASDLDDRCPDHRCPTGTQDKIDSASTWATVSTVSFVVGGVGIASGIVMLLLGKPSGTTSTAGVKPVLGARYLGLDGRF